MPSVFAKYQKQNYPHQFAGTLHVFNIFGGVPTDPNVAEGWLKTKLAPKDDLIREMVAETMLERGVDADEAATAVSALKHLNGFKRGTDGLYIEGRQLKAAIKEAASVAMGAGNLGSRGWGKTNKGLTSFIAEHVFVVEDRLPLGVSEPSGIDQSFVHTWRGTGIQYAEYVDDVKIDFTVESDWNFTDKEWAAIWTAGERQGIGAARSQGRGRYEVTKWERL